MSRYDIKEIKAAATGHWPAIINRVGGIDDDYLSSTHGPCPRCGGKDRWRTFDDFAQTGGAVCTQCGKFGDGIAVVQWYQGIGFPAALDKVGDFLGVTPAKKPAPSKAKSDPFRNIEWLQWSDMTAINWCARKKGFTLATLKAIGARQARYRRQYVVIALPVNDISGNLVGWSLYESAGGKLPFFAPGNKQPEWLKVKTIKGE